MPRTDVDFIERGRGEKQRLPRGQKRAVGRQRDAKAERTGGLQKRLQLRMQQRLSHDVQVQIVCIRPEFSCQQAKFLCRQRAGRTFRFRAEAACKVAAVCDFKIAAGKAHGRLLFVSVFLLYHTGGPLNSRRDCGIMKKE